MICWPLVIDYFRRSWWHWISPLFSLLIWPVIMLEPKLIMIAFINAFIFMRFLYEKNEAWPIYIFLPVGRRSLVNALFFHIMLLDCALCVASATVTALAIMLTGWPAQNLEFLPFLISIIIFYRSIVHIAYIHSGHSGLKLSPILQSVLILAMLMTVVFSLILFGAVTDNYRYLSQQIMRSLFLNLLLFAGSVYAFFQSWKLNAHILDRREPQSQAMQKKIENMYRGPGLTKIIRRFSIRYLLPESDALLTTEQQKRILPVVQQIYPPTFNPFRNALVQGFSAMLGILFLGFIMLVINHFFELKMPGDMDFTKWPSPGDNPLVLFFLVFSFACQIRMIRNWAIAMRFMRSLPWQARHIASFLTKIILSFFSGCAAPILALIVLSTHRNAVVAFIMLCFLMIALSLTFCCLWIWIKKRKIVLRDLMISLVIVSIGVTSFIVWGLYYKTHKIDVLSLGLSAMPICIIFLISWKWLAFLIADCTALYRISDRNRTGLI